MNQIKISAQTTQHIQIGNKPMSLTLYVTETVPLVPRLRSITNERLLPPDSGSTTLIGDAGLKRKPFNLKHNTKLAIVLLQMTYHMEKITSIHLKKQQKTSIL